MEIKVNENTSENKLSLGDVIKITYSHDEEIYYLVTEIPRSDKYVLLSLNGKGVYHGCDYENIEDITEELVGYNYKIYYQDEYALQLLKKSQ